MENTLENKAKFFVQYWDQNIIKVNMPMWGDESRIIDSITLESDSFKLFFLELTPLSQISDEDAIEVARILFGDSNDFAIEFNAAGITSVSPYGLPCYSYTIDINWSGEISYERASALKLLIAYDYLRSKGYALSWMGLSVEKLVEYKWLKLKEVK